MIKKQDGKVPKFISTLLRILDVAISKNVGSSSKWGSWMEPRWTIYFDIELEIAGTGITSSVFRPH